MGGFALPWIADKLNGMDLTILAAEPSACPTLTEGEYRYDFPDATGTGPSTLTYTLGHEFVPPPIHAGGLRYHGMAPAVSALRFSVSTEMRSSMRLRSSSIFLRKGSYFFVVIVTGPPINRLAFRTRWLGLNAGSVPRRLERWIA